MPTYKSKAEEWRAGSYERNLALARKQVEIATARDAVVKAALRRWRFEHGTGPRSVLEEQDAMQDYNAACAALARLEDDEPAKRAARRGA